MTATKVEKEERTRPGAKVRTEPPWDVILHNDWENSMPRVIWVLVRVIPGMTVNRATKVMWEVHTKSRAVAKTCHKALAELHDERLREEGLTVGIEPSR